MEEHYAVSIVEQSYKDNWESGEIEGTFQSVDLNDGHVFETPQEALRYFYNNYRGDLYGVYMIDDDETVKYGICSTAYAGQCGFEPANEEQLEAWKEGKIDLYNVEYILLINKVEAVKKIDLSNLGFEVEQG